jgi:Transposase DDE domain
MSAPMNFISVPSRSGFDACWIGPSDLCAGKRARPIDQPRMSHRFPARGAAPDRDHAVRDLVATRHGRQEFFRGCRRKRLQIFVSGADDAFQASFERPAPLSPSASSGHQLARVRRIPAQSRKPDRLVDARCDCRNAQPRTTPGGQPHYSHLAIETALTLRAAFRLTLRQSKGLIGSITKMLEIDLPRRSSLDRRQHRAEIARRGRMVVRKTWHGETARMAQIAHWHRRHQRRDRRF